MAPLDLTAGLPDIDPDAPTGPNLEDDGEFGALERAAQGTPERAAGNSVIPAEDPVWKDVAAQAAALLNRTYDLRVLVHLAIARLNLTGFVDFVAVLTTIRDQLETRWEQVHPQLDPEDDNDPTMRANALRLLAHPTRVLKVLRNVRLAASERAGPVSWRVIGASTGVLEGDDSPHQTESEIRAAFAFTGAARVGALREAVATALRELAAIGAVFDTHCGYGKDPEFDPLITLLREIARYIEIYATSDGESEATGDGADASDGEAGGAASVGAPAARGVSVASLNAVSTRADALRLLDIVCRYYEQHEPSSPLPLMIGRARKLADKSFLEILQDLAPDGVGQAQAVVQSRDSY
jgi:type VI secretion system protein ImpA